MEDITRDFSVEVKTGLKVVDDCEKCPNELWEDVRGIVQETANKHLIKCKPSKRTKWLSEEAVNIARKRRLAKAEGNHDRVKKLNASFQRVQYDRTE